MPRTYGTGTIEPLPDGRYRPRLPSPSRRRLPVCASQEEADALLAAAIRSVVAGAAVDPKALTLRAWGERWCDDRETSGLRGAVKDRRRWRLHIAASPLGDLCLRAIARADVVAWLDELLRKRVAPGRGHHVAPDRRVSRSTVQGSLNLLRVALGAALDRGLLDSNPARDVRLPRSAGVTHDPWTYLLPAEQERLFEAPGVPEADRLLAQFAVGTGLREGELWALRLVDVDQAAGRLTVRFGARGLPRKNGKILRVPLLPLAVDALERWLPLLAERPNPYGLVWPSLRGERRQGKAPRTWQAHLEASGLADPALRHDGQRVRFHDLRHTCASSLVAGWWGRRWSLEEVRALLGHSSITITQRYAHLADSALDAAVRETGAAGLSAHRSAHAIPAEVLESLAAPRRLERPAGDGVALQAMTPHKLEQLFHAGDPSLVAHLDAVRAIPGTVAIAAFGNEGGVYFDRINLPPQARSRKEEIVKASASKPGRRPAKPRPASRREKGSGTVYSARGAWYARLHVEGKRTSIALPSCATEAAALARLAILSGLAAKLRAAGARVRPGLALQLLRLAAERDGEKLAAVVQTVDELEHEDVKDAAPHVPAVCVTVCDLGAAGPRASSPASTPTM
jgi:integrase